MKLEGDALKRNDLFFDSKRFIDGQDHRRAAAAPCRAAAAG